MGFLAILNNGLHGLVLLMAGAVGLLVVSSFDTLQATQTQKVLILADVVAVTFMIVSSWIYTEKRRRRRIEHGLFRLLFDSRPMSPEVRSVRLWCRLSVLSWIAIVASLAMLSAAMFWNV